MRSMSGKDRLRRRMGNIERRAARLVDVEVAAGLLATWKPSVREGAAVKAMNEIALPRRIVLVFLTILVFGTKDEWSNYCFV
mmetsp:Transcript_20041/g.42158  ORF Transcript_20041/g.42158 Transcript_20041/m.42158 type:complete len:82 (-) Transcript_20041:2-247(-)